MMRLVKTLMAVWAILTALAVYAVIFGAGALVMWILMGGWGI